MGGQITLEGRKRPTGGSAQLLSPRSKAQVSRIRISDTPKGQSTPIAIVTLPSPTAVQSINIRHHTLRKYRIRPNLTPRAAPLSPIEPLPSSPAALTEEDLLSELPTTQAERRTYKLQRKVKFYEEVGNSRDGEPQLTLRRDLPNSARRESLAAAVELTRAPTGVQRTSILSLEPLRIPVQKEKPRPLQLMSGPETPVRQSWGSLLERGNR